MGWIKNCKCGKKLAIVKSNKTPGKVMPVHFESLDEEQQEQHRMGGQTTYEPGKHKPHWADCPYSAEYRGGNPKTRKFY